MRGKESKKQLCEGQCSGNDSALDLVGMLLSEGDHDREEEKTWDPSQRRNRPRLRRFAEREHASPRGVFTVFRSIRGYVALMLGDQQWGKNSQGGA